MSLADDAVEDGFLRRDKVTRLGAEGARLSQGDPALDAGAACVLNGEGIRGRGTPVSAGSPVMNFIPDGSDERRE